jgi:hypothetical protein
MLPFFGRSPGEFSIVFLWLQISYAFMIQPSFNCQQRNTEFEWTADICQSTFPKHVKQQHMLMMIGRLPKTWSTTYNPRVLLFLDHYFSVMRHFACRVICSFPSWSYHICATLQFDVELLSWERTLNWMDGFSPKSRHAQWPVYLMSLLQWSYKIPFKFPCLNTV